jgi:hypothetical protein
VRRRVGPNHRSRPTRSSAPRRGAGLAAHGLNDSAHSIHQRTGKQYLSALDQITGHAQRARAHSGAGLAHRLTRCRQARVPRYTLNAGAVLLDATARWIDSPVAPSALERTAARAWPSGTRVKRFCALHTPARWKTIPQRVGPNHRSRPARPSAQRRGPGLAAHGLNDSAHSIHQRAGKQYLSALDQITGRAPRARAHSGAGLA